MAIRDFEIIYVGGKLEVARSLMNFVWPLTGTLKAVRIIGSLIGVGTGTFNVRNNGSTIFSGGSRPAISNTDGDDEKTGLSVSVVRGQSGRLDLEVLTGGVIAIPLILLVSIDDGIADIPTGGTTGQALVKSSGDDYDIEWGTVSGGGGAEDLDDLDDVDTSGVSDGDVLAYDNGTSTWKPSAAGTGDVTGPASSVDNDIATFDSTTGKIIQDSGETITSVRAIPQESKSADYTLVLGDAGKHIFHPSSDANDRTFTIPANSSVAFPVGSAVTFVNLSANDLSIELTTDTWYLAGDGDTGDRTLAQYGIATAVKVASTVWVISGVGLT